jgi:predicted alpha/beta superfamily hydrolase
MPPLRAPSAQPNVTLLAPLPIAALQRQRALRLYLPPDYAQSGKRYPVIYMHDGQNLFDAATSYAGEWEVDETLDALAAAGKLEAIVVGVDNGGEQRMRELNPWDHPTYGKGEGDAYLDFIVNVVKPMIDQRYRTLPDRANTAIAGSSMGGFISHYAIGRYPDVFGKAGVLSPSYWANDARQFGYVAGRPAAPDARIYLLMGANEGDSMVPDVERMHAQLLKSGHPAANVKLKIVPGGTHGEALWRGELGEALMWMFARQDGG